MDGDFSIGYKHDGHYGHATNGHAANNGQSGDRMQKQGELWPAPEMNPVAPCGNTWDLIDSDQHIVKFGASAQRQQWNLDDAHDTSERQQQQKPELADKEHDQSDMDGEFGNGYKHDGHDGHDGHVTNGHAANNGQIATDGPDQSDMDGESTASPPALVAVAQQASSTGKASPPQPGDRRQKQGELWPPPWSLPPERVKGTKQRHSGLVQEGKDALVVGRWPAKLSARALSSMITSSDALADRQH